MSERDIQPPVPEDERAGGTWPSLADIFAARRVVREYLPRTPLVRSNPLSDAFDAEVYLKRDDTLPTGSFKIRGGITLASHLGSENDDGTVGLITASTGNHGQSIAFAGREVGLPVEIVVPDGANPTKVHAIEDLGADVVVHGQSMDEAFAWAQERASDRDARFVHPAAESHLVAGVATAGLEVVEDIPGTDIVFSPVGSGSYATGFCLTAGRLTGADVIGVQSSGADAAYRAYHEGGLNPIGKVDTFAEGIAVGTPFEATMRVLRDELTDFVRVSDDDLRAAMRRLLTDERIVAEAAGVASLAGAVSRGEDLAGRTVVLPVSGRNVSARNLASLFDRDP